MIATGERGFGAATSGLGVEAQRQQIADYCRAKGVDLAGLFEDPGVSGGKPLAIRPAGRRLLVEARTTKAVVVAFKLDRLFRSVSDAASTIATAARSPSESAVGCEVSVIQQILAGFVASLPHLSASTLP